MTQEYPLPLDWQFDVRTLGNRPKTFQYLLDKSQGDEVAKLAGLLEISSMSLSGEIKGGKRGQIALQAHLKAETLVECVKTLEPIEYSIDTEFEMAYFLSESAVNRSNEGSDTVVISIDDADPPEQLDGHFINLGDTAIEHLILSIDPYPCKADLPEGENIYQEADHQNNVFAGPFANLREKLDRAGE